LSIVAQHQIPLSRVAFSRRPFLEDSTEVLLSDDAQKILQCKRAKHVKNSYHPGFDFVHTPTAANFTVAGHFMQMLETQNCRLLKHMISFNSKAIPVFTLIHYWAKVNKIGFERCATLVDSVSPVKAKEPAALEWLVACFLASKKVIPTPREVMARGPRKFFDFGGQDIGFIEDEAFVSHWKGKHGNPQENEEEFVLSILKLVREFFAFLSSLATQDFVVNTRDGELVEKQVFRDFAAGKSIENLEEFTKLTMEEFNKICFDEKRGQEKYLALKVGNDYLNIVSPFFWHEHFSLDSRNFFANISRAVKQSGEKIEKFLASFENGSQNEVDLESLLHL